MNKILNIILLSASIIGCSSDKPQSGGPGCPPPMYFLTQTDYKVEPDATTPKGMLVDNSGQNYNLSRIDRMTDELEACLIKTFGNPPILPDSVMSAGHCGKNTFTLPIPRNCFAVKIVGPNDWHISVHQYPDHFNQLLNQKSPCDPNKGDSGDSCYYRVGVQNYYNVVIPPSGYLFKDGLERVVVGCDTIWDSPELAACAQPSSMTGPLDDGMGP